MIKVPKSFETRPEEDIERRSQFVHDFGALLSVWAELEMAIEVKISRLVGMKPLDASIVLGSLQAGMKKNILYSLLRERGQTEEIAKVKAAVSFAKRNVLVHSQMAAEHDFSGFSLFNREVNDAYKVRRHDYTADTFHEHFLKFRELAFAAQAALEIKWDDMREYGREARFEGLN